MAQNRIYIQVDFNKDSASSAVDQFNRKLANIDQSAQAASRGATGSLRSVAVSVRQTADSFDALRASIVGLGIGKLGVDAVSAGSDLRKAQIGLETLLGSAREATAVFAQMKKLSLESPFKFEDLSQGAVTLKAMGIETSKLARTMRASADAAAGLAGGVEKLRNIATPLGQTKGKGRVSLEEINTQLAEAGVDAPRYLAEYLSKELNRRVSRAETLKLIEKGRLDADVTVDVIVAGMEQQFGGMAKRLATEVDTNLFAKMAQSARFVLAEIGYTLQPAVRGAIGAMKGLVDAASFAVTQFRLLPPWLQATAAGLVAIAAASAVLPSALNFFAFLPANVKATAGLLASFARTMRTLGQVISIAFAYSSVSGFFVLMRSELPLLLTLLNGVALAATAVAGAFAGWKLGQWLKTSDTAGGGSFKAFNELIQEQVWKRLGFVGNEDIKTLEASRSMQEWAVRDMQQRLTQRKVQVPTPEMPLQKMSDEALSDYATQLRSAAINAAEAEGETRKKLLKEQAELAAQQVASARSKYEQTLRQTMVGPRRLEAEYAHFYREMRGNEEALHYVRMAFELDFKAEKDKLWSDQRKQMGDYLDALKQEYERRRDWDIDLFQRRLEFQRESLEMERETLRSRLEADQGAIDYMREEKLLALETVQAVTPAERMALEQQKAAIQAEAAIKTRDLELALIKEQYEFDVGQQRASLLAKQITYEQFKEREAVIGDKYIEQSRQAIVDAGRQANRANQEASVRSGQIMLEEQRRIFDNLKDSAGRVFDALLQKSSNVFAAIGNAFKTAILTAIREVVTSRVAAALMQMFGYGTVSFRGDRGGLGGQQPIFGPAAGGSGGGLLKTLTGGAGAIGLGPIFGKDSFIGGPGGTTGFAGPVAAQGASGLAGGSAGTTAGGRGLTGGLLGNAGLATGLKGLAYNAGSINMGAYSTTAAGIGGPMGGLAGFASSTGGALAGAGLLYTGARMGGKTGAALMAGGGALTGFFLGAKLGMIGGPMGAVIGAAIGGGIGLLMMLRKTAEQKAREKVKQVYGIDIGSKSILTQIVEISKSGFGGNLDVALRSTQIRELVQLYAMTTGQNAGGMPRPMYNVSFAQSGAGLAMNPVYQNGLVVANPYTGTTTTQWGQPGNTYVQLDPRQANELLEGRVVQIVDNNSTAVSNSMTKAMQAGTNRTATRGLATEPLTVMA